MDLTQIYHKFGNVIYRIAFNYTKSKEDSEDILQDVLVSYFVKRPKIHQNDEDGIKYWLIRVTINKSLNFIKKAWNKTTGLNENILGDYIVFDEKNDVYSAVLSLPLKYREIIFLYYYQDLSVRQIAKLLKQSESGVKTNLFRARDKLKEILGDDYYYEI